MCEACSSNAEEFRVDFGDDQLRIAGYDLSAESNPLV
jgi:hypothetical protein